MSSEEPSITTETASEAQQYLRGGWMQTQTGRKFYPLSPTREMIAPRDIAHALGLICRYGGHVDRFYSVAEHCVLMSHAVPPEDAAWALLHDATEAYVGDMVRPLKREIPQYRLIENRLMDVICARFGLDSIDMPASVKDADNRILLTERDALMANTRYDWEQDDLTPLPVTIHAWSPTEAKNQYLNRMWELGLIPSERFIRDAGNRTMPSEAWDETHPDHLEWVASNKGVCPVGCQIHSPVQRNSWDDA